MSMLNFDFKNPTRIVFGKGQIAKLSQYIPKDKTILIIYGGGSIKRNGVYEQVMKALEGYTVEEFGGIEPNPDFDTCMKAVEIVKRIGPDNVFLLAVGGGSVIDGTKFISAASVYTHSEDPFEILLTNGIYCTAGVPLGSVLTLPATGSEMNHGSVISRRAVTRKLSFFSPFNFPVVSILDPTTTYSLPTKQTANGVVDAFVHVCEQYVTFPQHADVQDRYSEALLKVLYENGKKVMEDPNNYDVRANIMWAATQALNHWNGQGVVVDWATHMIGQELTAYIGLDHGQTLAIIQPRVFEHCFEQKKEKLAQMAERVFNIKEGTVEEKARKCIDIVVDFYDNIVHVPTHISQYNCSQDKAWIDDLVRRWTEEKYYPGECQIKPDEVKKIILESY